MAKTPLVEIVFPSIYKVGGNPVPLPKRMAHCTPDMKTALANAAAELSKKNGKLVLSDLFRSYDMQLGSHLDYKSGKKSAYSPPPGGSLHEAGRALDLDLDQIKISLKDFWGLAKKQGLVPIISSPKKGVSESWHFECRGSHQKVYDYYKQGHGNNFSKPYQAMAASAICAVGVQVDKFGKTKERQDSAYIQSGLIRLGHKIGNMDGAIGPKTRAGLAAQGIAIADLSAMIAELDVALQAKFPGEFFDKRPDDPEIDVFGGDAEKQPCPCCGK